MNRRGVWALVFSLVVLSLFVIGMFMFFALYKPINEKDLIKGVVAVKSPISSLTTEQIEKQFNESFVYYLLYNIKAYDLHNPPLSGNVPKIKIVVDGDVYFAVVEKGKIKVSKADLPEADVIIKTNKKEAAKMIKNKAHIQESFKLGSSSLELLADKATLFAKGYLNLYTELTGKSVTGNVVRIYAN